LLKEGTAGVCTRIGNNMLEIAFENGEDKSLTFTTASRGGRNGVYSLDADKWIKPYNGAEVGKITYDGETYFMRFTGTRPKLMIKKTANDKYEVDKRTMGGRKL